MWLKPGSKPLAFEARQSIAVTEGGFLWRARFGVAGVPLQIIDYLVGGEGGLEDVCSAPSVCCAASAATPCSVVKQCAISPN
jgi:hypothetical protein